MNPRRLKAYLYLLCAAFIWGFAAVVIKFTLNGIEPLPFLTYRFAISTLIALFSFNAIRRLLEKRITIIFWMIIYSLLSTTIALGFLFFGLKETTVLNLSLMTLLGPLLASIAGVVFLREKITKQEKIGTAIAFIGTFFTIIEPILEIEGKSTTFIGNLLLVIYLISDVASVIILKKLLRKGISPLALTNLSFVIAFLSILPITIFSQSSGKIISDIFNLPFIYHAGVWYMAVFSGTAAYALRAKGQKTVEVQEASLFGYLTAVFSIPLAVLLLKEKITILYLLGAAIIVIGVAIAEYKKKVKR